MYGVIWKSSRSLSIRSSRLICYSPVNCCKLGINLHKWWIAQKIFGSAKNEVQLSITCVVKGHHHCHFSVNCWRAFYCCKKKGACRNTFKDPVLSSMLHGSLLLSLFAQEQDFYCFSGFCFSRGKHSIAWKEIIMSRASVSLNLLY